MRILAVCGLVLVIAMPAVAQTPTLKISLGVRESVTTTPIGSVNNPIPVTAPGGGIEYFNRDAQTLPLDNTWKKFTFDVSATGIDPLGGLTGNGLINSNTGALDCLRIVRPAGAGATAVQVWVDRMEITYKLNDFDETVISKTITTLDGANNGGVPYAAGTEVLFQEPGYSGSTAAMIQALPVSVSAIDTTTGQDDSYSEMARWKWLYTHAVYKDSPWLRFTSYGSTLKERHPTLAIAGGPGNLYLSSSVSVWMKGVPEPASLSLLALGGLALLRRR